MEHQSTAVATTVATQVVDKASSFIGEVIGDSVKNLAGLMGGDWLMVAREENLERLRRKSRDRLQVRGVENPSRLSISVAVPLLKEAADESREELADLWADLLAAAMDPTSTSKVSRNMIDTVKQMEPLDVLVMSNLDVVQPRDGLSETITDVRNKLGKTTDEILVSYSNLMRIGLLCPLHGGNINEEHSYVRATAKGRELMRVLGR